MDEIIASNGANAAHLSGYSKIIATKALPSALKGDELQAFAIMAPINQPNTRIYRYFNKSMKRRRAPTALGDFA